MVAEVDTKIQEDNIPPTSGFLRPGSVSVAILTLAKGTLGAGVLTLSQKTMYSGIPVFLVLLSIGGFFSAKSIEMIAKGADMTGKYVFEEITEAMYGRKMGIVLGVSMLLNCYGASIVYVIAIKGSLEALLVQVQASTGVDWPLYATLILGATVLVPLSVVERLNSLRILSLAGVMGVFCTVASVVYALSISGVADDLETSTSSTVGTLMSPQGGFVQMMTVMGTVTFAFCNQFNVPQVYQELSIKTPSNARRIAYLSTCLAMVVYVITAFSGYLCYGLEIEDNLLLNFKPLIEAGNVLMYMGVSAVTLSVSMSHLLNNFPMRLSVLFFLSERFENNRMIRLAVPLFTAVSTIAIALIYSNLSVFLGLVGAATGSVIGYIVPALFSIRAIEMEEEISANEKPLTRTWVAQARRFSTEYLMIFVGLIIGIVGTFCEFYSCFH